MLVYVRDAATGELTLRQVRSRVVLLFPVLRSAPRSGLSRCSRLVYAFGLVLDALLVGSQTFSTVLLSAVRGVPRPLAVHIAVCHACAQTASETALAGAKRVAVSKDGQSVLVAASNAVSVYGALSFFGLTIALLLVCAV